MKRIRKWFPAALAGLLAGCMTLGPDYSRPKSELPDRWQGESAAHAPDRWWQVYGDSVLDRMIDEAVSRNSNLALAIARIDEARGALGVTRADQLPAASAQADRSGNRGSQSTVIGIPPGYNPVYDDFRGSLNASFEIDIWGKYRRATEAARATLLSLEYTRDSVRLTLQADVVKGYFNLRALDSKVEITRDTIRSRVASLDLQRLRFQAGLASELELRQVEAEAAAAQALLPELENQMADQETALSVILGHNPRELFGSPAPERGKAIEALAVPPPVPSGLPSELLDHRPDIREAELQMVAANAQIGEAKAAFFPSISLTGLFGAESASLSNLFTTPSTIWQISGSVGQLLYDGGRASSNLRILEARKKEALIQYEIAVRNAFQDILNALVAQRKAHEALDANMKRTEALEVALKLAEARYQNGVASQLDLLDAERGLLDAELSRIEAQRIQLAGSADLFKALGGGWNSTSDPSGVRQPDRR